jgi:hypothetical protein
MSKKKSESGGAIRTHRRPMPGTTTAVEGSTRHDEGEPGPVPFSAEELQRISREISARALPPVEPTRLELMEIDPWNVYAYWHIDPVDLAAGRASLPESSRDSGLVLRFSDISPRQKGTEAFERFDIQVREDSSNWYVNLWRDARRYSAEIGLRAADGAFVSLARSNEVATPRGGPSPELDFLRVEVHAPSVPEPVPVGGSTTPSDILLRDLFPRRQPLDEDFPMIMAESSGNPFDEPAFPPLEATGQESAAAGSSAGEALGAAGVEAANRAEVDEKSAGGMEFPMPAAVEIDRSRRLAHATRDSALAEAGLPPLPPVAEETIAPAGVALTSHPLPIPPATAAGDTAPGEGAVMHAADPPYPPTPVALEAILGNAVFSPGATDAAVDVSASIVIEGQGLPDAPLSLFGEPVQLQPDGRFTLRLPLERRPDLVALLHHVREQHRRE